MTKKATGLERAINHVGNIHLFAKATGAKPAAVKEWLAADEPAAPPDSAVLTAITKAGGPTAMAKALGVTPQAVWDWRAKGYVPLARAKEIEMQFGIPRGDLVSAKVRSNLGLGGEL